MGWGDLRRQARALTNSPRPLPRFKTTGRGGHGSSRLQSIHRVGRFRPASAAGCGSLRPIPWRSRTAPLRAPDFPCKVIGGRDGPDRVKSPAVAEPVDPFQGCVTDGHEAAPLATAVHVLHALPKQQTLGQETEIVRALLICTEHPDAVPPSGKDAARCAATHTARNDSRPASGGGRSRPRTGRAGRAGTVPDRGTARQPSSGAWHSTTGRVGPWGECRGA